MRKTTEHGGLGMGLTTAKRSMQPLLADHAAPPANAEPARSNRLYEMRDHLRAAKPQSGNEALRLLRAAFPQTPLSERVEAARTLSFSG